jgi:hypothetical protein
LAAIVGFMKGEKITRPRQAGGQGGVMGRGPRYGIAVAALVVGVMVPGLIPTLTAAHGVITAASVAGCYAGNALVDGVPVILELVFEPSSETTGTVTIHAGADVLVRPYTVDGGAILVDLGDGVVVHGGPALLTGGRAFSLSLTSFPGAAPKIAGSVFLYSTD